LLNQTLPATIRPLAAGMRVAGPAFTVEGRSHPGIGRDVSIRAILDMLGSIPHGSVGLYQTGDNSCAHFGELSAVSLRSRGCAGVVVYGGCRDVNLIRRTALPVFACYQTPQDAVGRWEVVGFGHEI